MKMCPMIMYTGNCREAFEFYAKILGGKIIGMYEHAQTPAASMVPEELKHTIIHARLQVGDQLLMGCDAPPERYHGSSGFSVSLLIDSLAEADRIYEGLSEGGSVVMPIGETFWAQRFGMVVDKFGILWMVNYGEKTF